MPDDTFPFSDDDNDSQDEGDTAPPADNATIKQMREALDRAEKRNKSYEKTVEKLTELPADPPQIVDIGTAFLVQVKP